LLLASVLHSLNCFIYAVAYHTSRPSSIVPLSPCSKVTLQRFNSLVIFRAFIVGAITAYYFRPPKDKSLSKLLPLSFLKIQEYLCQELYSLSKMFTWAKRNPSTYITHNQLLCCICRGNFVEICASDNKKITQIPK
jgi:hypothetical protein